MSTRLLWQQQAPRALLILSQDNKARSLPMIILVPMNKPWQPVTLPAFPIQDNHLTLQVTHLPVQDNTTRQKRTSTTPHKIVTAPPKTLPEVLPKPTTPQTLAKSSMAKHTTVPRIQVAHQAMLTAALLVEAD